MNQLNYHKVKLNDLEVSQIINNELDRQINNIQLIASENFVSNDVLKATGSVLTNKYAEGYPAHRYYHGCENADDVESLAIKRLKKLFNVEFANVQAHSGSQANTIAYAALLKPGDKILGMALSAGGHLTHGSKVSFSGIIYKASSYGVNSDGLLDYDEIEKIAVQEQPQVIVAGASSYARVVDFSRFAKIAKKVNAFLVADIAHIAGLIVAGYHPTPVGHADVITSTTHKTLRGARGGLLLTNDPLLAKKINSAAFPGNQGGPLMHSIAGKAVAFGEALKPEFKSYIKAVCDNAKVFANKFKELGVKVVSGGTDNHLFNVDVYHSYKITGKVAADTLFKVGITLNKNMIPNDQFSPFHTSGIRIGTPAMTTVGFKSNQFESLAVIINDVLKNPDDQKNLAAATNQVKKLLQTVW